MQLAGVDNETAKRLFDQYLPFGRALARQFRRLEMDDILQVSRMAIVDAYLTHDPAQGAALATWARHKIYWALVNLVRETEDKDLHRAERTGTDPQLANGANPEERFWQATAVRALRQLDPRAALVVDAHIHGESLRNIAHSLGVCYQRVHQEEARALTQLRAVLDEEVDMVDSRFRVVETLQCHCGEEVMHAVSGDQLVTLHKKPTCDTFDRLHTRPAALQHWLKTGVEVAAPNRRERRRLAAQQRRRGAAV